MFYEHSVFVKYCNEFDGQIHLCGLSLGGILALNFALDFPQKVKTLVLIGTPYKVPKVAFSFQNIIFRFKLTHIVDVEKLEIIIKNSEKQTF